MVQNGKTKWFFYGKNMQLSKKATNVIVDMRKDSFINDSWVLIELSVVLMVGMFSRDTNSMNYWLIFN